MRDRGLNVRALHGDMSQGQRDGVMLSFKGGRVPVLVATDVAARGLDISTVTHVVNYDVPTSPDVYVHRIGRTGRVGRSGPRDHVRRAAPAARAAAIERHIGTPITPWVEGAHTPPGADQRAPAPALQAAPLARERRAATRSSSPAVGRAEGIEVADLVHAVTAAAGIDGEAVRDVRVLERFSLLSVPRSEAERIVAAVDGTRLNGTSLRLELARA